MMMKLMMKMAKQNTIFIGNEQTMEPAMPDDCRQAKHIHMKKDMYRMRGDNQMY